MTRLGKHRDQTHTVPCSEPIRGVGESRTEGTVAAPHGPSIPPGGTYIERLQPQRRDLNADIHTTACGA